MTFLNKLSPVAVIYSQGQKSSTSRTAACRKAALSFVEGHDVGKGRVKATCLQVGLENVKLESQGKDKGVLRTPFFIFGLGLQVNDGVRPPMSIMYSMSASPTLLTSQLA